MSENYRKITQLLNDAERIEKFASEFERITSQPKCDKYGYGFNRDQRFSSGIKATVSFNSWHGYYGNSSCSEMLNISEENGKRFLVAALNKLQPQIFETMAALMRLDASTLVSEAEREIAQMSEALEKAKSLSVEESS